MINWPRVFDIHSESCRRYEPRKSWRAGTKFWRGHGLADEGLDCWPVCDNTRKDGRSCKKLRRRRWNSAREQPKWKKCQRDWESTWTCAENTSVLAYLEKEITWAWNRTAVNFQCQMQTYIPLWKNWALWGQQYGQKTCSRRTSERLSPTFQSLAKYLGPCPIWPRCRHRAINNRIVSGRASSTRYWTYPWSTSQVRTRNTQRRDEHRYAP